MEEKKEFIIKYIKSRVSSMKELGKEYSEEKIKDLAEKLLSTNKTIDDITILIDNKFSNQIRKINHNNHLSSLKAYYIANIDKLKKGNNCYLLSYDKGIKVLEQAFLKDKRKVNDTLKVVSINNKKEGYKKEISVATDKELIMSDVAYLLNIPYANTYRIFDASMNPIGVLNETFTNDAPTDRFLTLNETFQFVKEESSKFVIKNQVIEYHDQNIKYGLKETVDIAVIKSDIEYVLKLFKALPDITTANFNKLKSAYLNMKVFELLANSIDNNLTNVGIIVHKDKVKYNYSLSPAYNKSITKMPNIAKDDTICNFHIAAKSDVFQVLIENYYEDIKELLTLITDNKTTLFSLIDQVIKEHLEYEEYNDYHKTIIENINYIVEKTNDKKKLVPDLEEEKAKYTKNNENYNERILPFMDNYVVEDVSPNEKGSALLVSIVAVVLIITILIIIATIYAVSKVDM